MKNKKKLKTKIVGSIESKHCKKYNISQYANYKIEQSLGLIYHVQKHMNDFISVDSFNITMASITQIISRPYFVYYDPVKNSLKYFKKIKEYICVVVNIVGDGALVSTVYPVNKKNIDKLKNKVSFSDLIKKDNLK